MTHTKNLRQKNLKSKNTKNETEEENESEALEVEEPKPKKTVDLEAALEPASIEEKVEEGEELSLIGDDPEEGSEELSFDDEELNPFGDKWEQ